MIWPTIWFLYAIVGIALLAAGYITYLLWFQPPFYFPKPTGPYAVGTREYHWVDTKRKEMYSEDSTRPHRELMVKIWAPSPGPLPSKPTTPYAPYPIAYYKKLARLLRIARPVYTYAKSEAPIAPSTLGYPVVIFSHGFGCVRDGNTAQCEELANHGYIVVGLSHTYDSRVVQFPGGRIADGKKSMAKRARISKTSLLADPQTIEVWISDVQFVLDQLEQLNNDPASLFYQQLDRQHIGMFGYSFGGATAAHICQRESHVKAGVDLDGSLWQLDTTKNFNKPFMFMLGGNKVKLYEQRARSNFLPAIKQLSQTIGHDVYTFIVKDAGHADFSDYALLKGSPIFARFFSNATVGSIGGLRATEIVNAYLVNFFDKYLKGKPSALLDGKGQFAEVEARRTISTEPSQKRVS